MRRKTARPGWRDSYGEKVGWTRAPAKAEAGKAAERDSGEGMITGYHISGPLLRVLRFPFLLWPSLHSSFAPSALCILTFVQTLLHRSLPGYLHLR